MIASLILLMLVPPADNDAWPGFLGAGASEVAAESLPAEWSPESNVAWTADLPGYGQSTPVIWDGHIFLTAVVGDMKDECVTLCLSLEDGSEVWKHGVESDDKVEASVYVSRAAPTPVVDATGVFSFFESGNLVAYSHAGEVLWERSLADDYGKFENRFCISSSLAQTDDAIFVLGDHEGPSYLAKLSKEDGHTIWKRDRESRTSWSSPAIMSVDGRDVLVISSTGAVDGYDPESGDKLFGFDGVGGNTVCTPIPFGDGMFLVGAAPGPQGENAAVAERSNLAMKVEFNDEGEASVSVAWRAERATSSFGSPIVYNGLAYWVNRSGVVACFDAETGEEQFTGRLAESIWATPMGIGDRVYFFGQTGTTTVLESGSEFKKVGEYRLWEEEPSENQGRGNFGGRTQYGAAAVNGSLLLRTGDILYCLRK